MLFVLASIRVKNVRLQPETGLILSLVFLIMPEKYLHCDASNWSTSVANMLRTRFLNKFLP